MVTGLLIIAIVSLLGVMSHRRTRLENRVYKNVPLAEWLIVLVVPVAIFFGWVMVVKNIIARTNVAIFLFDDIDILAIMILSMAYAFVGNAFHFTGKILWRYLQRQKYSMAYKVNEMFHGKLSHYLVFLNAIVIIFLLPILEINHPMAYQNSNTTNNVLVLAGVIFGMSSIKMIFYTNEWFGGYNKPLFFVMLAFLTALLTFVQYFKLDLGVYPVTLFVASMGFSSICTFIFRQMAIFTKLGNKRRLRFLAKILSA